MGHELLRRGQAKLGERRRRAGRGEADDDVDRGGRPKKPKKKRLLFAEPTKGQGAREGWEWEGGGVCEGKGRQGQGMDGWMDGKNRNPDTTSSLILLPMPSSRHTHTPLVLHPVHRRPALSALSFFLATVPLPQSTRRIRSR